MIRLGYQINQFLEATGMNQFKFGELAAENKNLVPRIRAGGDVTTKTADRIEKFMSDYMEQNSKS